MNFRHVTFDPRFTTPHPDTERWFAQRDKCADCANLQKIGPEMRCRVSPMKGKGIAARRLYLHCIDARLDNQPCGPDARLYSPKGKT